MPLPSRPIYIESEMSTVQDRQNRLQRGQGQGHLDGLAILDISRFPHALLALLEKKRVDTADFGDLLLQHGQFALDKGYAHIVLFRLLHIWGEWLGIDESCEWRENQRLPLLSSSLFTKSGKQ